MIGRKQFNKIFFQIFEKNFLIYYDGHPTRRCVFYPYCRDTSYNLLTNFINEPAALEPISKVKTKSKSGLLQFLMGLSILGYHLCKMCEKDNVEQQKLQEPIYQNVKYTKGYRYTQTPRPPR